LADDGLNFLFLVEAIPELRGDEEILALNETLSDRALNTLAGGLFVAVI
jgi:hypothetical protein